MTREVTMAAIAVAGLVAYALIVGPFSSPSRASTTSPAPRDHEWLARHDLFLARAARGPVDVVFIGDSITEQWLTSGRRVWHARFAPLGAANLGIGSDGTQHVLWRVRHGELGEHSPRAVVLLAGTVNLNPPRPASAREVADGIAAVVAEIRARAPRSRIVLVGVLPRTGPTSPAPEVIREINALSERLADGQRVVYVNAGARLRSAGLPLDAFLSDGIHLTEAGYAALADAIEPVLRAVLRAP